MSQPFEGISTSKESGKFTRRSLMALGVATLAACAPEAKVSPTTKPTTEAPVETNTPAETESPTTPATQETQPTMPEGAVEPFTEDMIGGFEANTSPEELESRARFTAEDLAEGNEDQLAQKVLDTMSFALNGIRTEEFARKYSDSYISELSGNPTEDPLYTRIEDDARELVTERTAALMRAWGDDDWQVEKNLAELHDEIVEIGVESTSNWFWVNNLPYDTIIHEYHRGTLEGAEDAPLEEYIEDAPMLRPLYEEDVYRDTFTKVGQERYPHGPNTTGLSIIYMRKVQGPSEILEEAVTDNEESLLYNNPELIEGEGQRTGMRVVFDDKLSDERGRPLLSHIDMGSHLANLIKSR